MPIKDKPEAKKERPRFTDTTKAEPKNDSLMTSSTADPNRSSDPVPGEDEQTQGVRDSDKGIVFHRSSWKCGVVYWRHGFSLPENGRMKIKGDALTFKGIVTSKAFQLNDIDVEKTSRMGGFVHDAFIISVRSTEGKGQDGNGEYFFSTVMKDRKKVLDKIQTAIANVKLGKEEENFDAISGRGGKRGAKTKFRMPPDPTLQKMDTIAKKKLKGVSLQDYYEVAWSEGHGCDKKPMYGPFLEKQGKNNVTLTQWETGKYKGDWCGEEYTHERVVAFEFMKQTIGQTLVKVKHTQRCRRIDNDQCIVHISMEMKGIFLCGELQ